MLCRKQTLGLIHDVKVMSRYIHRTNHRCVKVSLSIQRKSALGRHFGNGVTEAGDIRTSRLNVQLLTDPEKASNLTVNCMNC